MLGPIRAQEMVVIQVVTQSWNELRRASIKSPSGLLVDTHIMRDVKETRGAGLSYMACILCLDRFSGQKSIPYLWTDAQNTVIKEKI